MGGFHSWGTATTVRTTARTALITAAVLAAVPLQAQDSGEPAPTLADSAYGVERLEARAARRDGDIHVDGRLDEAAWRAAAPITTFVQGEPTEGIAPTEPTEVRVLFDNDALYVGARMFESDPTTIHAQLVRRDQDMGGFGGRSGSSDYFEVMLDPNLDGLTGYLFRINAAGAEGDAYLYNDVEDDSDWDAVWSSGVHQDSLGWSAELRIPFSQIRYESGRSVQTWGVNFVRRRLESNEIDYFSLESRTVRGKVSQFGVLEGVQIAAASRRVEITPFVVSQLHTAPAEDGDPLFTGSDFEPRGGVDASIGIGSAFSLDATFNPDFGQVEVDPEVINLTAFETFFPEKRPFFVQDARVFDFAGSRGGRGGRGGKSLFFSRRIGRAPSGDAPSAADFSTHPAQTTILGAAKLTGRTGGGLSVGALAAVTQGEKGDVYFIANDSTGRFLAEPQTEYGVLRLQQDFRGGGSKVGLMLTGLKRELPDDGNFDVLTSNAYSFGIDYEHAWGGARGRDFRVWGFFSGSLVRGSEEALLRIQRSSTHYFQRPDADYLEVDSTATSMFGTDWRIQLERQSARHWTWAVWLGQQSPGFEINDLGFITSGERLDGGARITYRQIQPGRLFRTYNVSLFTFHNWRHSLLDDFFSASNWARSHETGSFWLRGDFTFLNNWSADLSFSWRPQSQSDTQTRGGPLMTDPAETSLSFGVSTDRRKAISVRPNVRYEQRYRGGGDVFSTSLDLSLRPASNWEIEIGPSYSRQRDGAQYVTQLEDAAYEPTFGRRYLFGDLQRQTLSMETRLNVAFSPDLSLQLYAQPLISSGDYLTYRQLLRPESYDFDDFTEGVASVIDGAVSCEGGTTCLVDDDRYFDFDGDGEADFDTSERDFNIRSIRGNAVLRWEYRPGSLIYLVWQHSRRERLDVGDFDLGRDLGGLFDAPAENVFILKVSYYLPF